ncbi:MAG: hypothetical protein EAX95_03800 [Candidatus Thorarchaeota archaeon]|nr:hypothetical protein [Candidatus Thorarchaeota archaeon]
MNPNAMFFEVKVINVNHTFSSLCDFAHVVPLGKAGDEYTMMNRFQDLMRANNLVRIVVDAPIQEFYLQVVDGKIKHVSKEYCEVERLATPDEKSKHGADKVCVLIPFTRIIEVICYDIE